MKRTITVTLTQAEARVLNAGAAELSEQLSAGDLYGTDTQHRLAAQAAAITRARAKLWEAGMELES
jgi:hypothetical protein